MRVSLVTLLLLIMGCGRDVVRSLEVQGTGEVRVNAMPDAGQACGTLPFGPDCCEGGRRSGSAACVSGTWTCGGSGDFCTCAGKLQTFQCAEYCGADAFAAPDCVNGEWACAGPGAPTTMCGSDICWGDPGDCCGGPSCVEGAWVCAFKPSGC